MSYYKIKVISTFSKSHTLYQVEPPKSFSPPHYILLKSFETAEINLVLIDCKIICDPSIKLSIKLRKMLWTTQMIRRKWRFRVPLSFSWKARLRTKPLIWKCFFIFIFTQIKLIFTRKVSHLASFWKWEFLELGTPFNFSLLTDWFSPPLTRELVRTLSTFSNVIKCYIICKMVDSQEVGKKVQLL